MYCNDWRGGSLGPHPPPIEAPGGATLRTDGRKPGGGGRGLPLEGGGYVKPCGRLPVHRAFQADDPAEFGGVVLPGVCGRARLARPDHGPSASTKPTVAVLFVA